MISGQAIEINEAEAKPVPANGVRSQLRPGGRCEQARSLATRTALMAAARDSFGKLGFHATRTNDLVAITGMTRGALYHHFATKEDLFEAVARQVADEITATAAASTQAMKGDTWPRMIASMRAHLALMATSSEIQRILLIDGPAVLGWSRWQDLQADAFLAGTIETLDMLVERGVIADQPREPLARIIVAGLNDAALAIAHSGNSRARSVEMADALVSLVTGLRLPHAS